MKQILINNPGDGEWIMQRCGGVFRPGMDHSLATHGEVGIRGGFVVCNYLGNSCATHDAGADPRWCSRDLLWMLFHYVFVQLGCHKLYAPVSSKNTRALAIDLRAGFKLEATLPDAIAWGEHLMLLGMDRTTCKWLKQTPKQYFPGGGGTITTVVSADE